MDFQTNRCYTLTTTLTPAYSILSYTHLKELNKRLPTTSWERELDKQMSLNDETIMASFDQTQFYTRIHITINDNYELTTYSGQTTY